jgi:hypothetical protein
MDTFSRLPCQLPTNHCSGTFPLQSLSGEMFSETGPWEGCLRAVYLIKIPQRALAKLLRTLAPCNELSQSHAGAFSRSRTSSNRGSWGLADVSVTAHPACTGPFSLTHCSARGGQATEPATSAQRAPGAMTEPLYAGRAPKSITDLPVGTLLHPTPRHTACAAVAPSVSGTCVRGTDASARGAWPGDVGRPARCCRRSGSVYLLRWGHSRRNHEEKQDGRIV